MATVYKNWAQVMADGAAGKLKWSDSTDSGGLMPYLLVHGANAAQVNALLAVVKTTEPNEDWVKGGWLGVDKNGKLLIGAGNLPKTLAPEMTPQGPLAKPGFGGQFAPFNVVFDKNLWIRVAEFAVGGIILAIGANALVRQGTGIDVIGTGKRVGRVVTRL